MNLSSPKNHHPASAVRRTRVWWIMVLGLILLARSVWGQAPTTPSGAVIVPANPVVAPATNAVSLGAGLIPFKLNLGMEGS